MRRIQISLTEEDRRLLDAESARTGHSVAALIREAVQSAYSDRPPVAGDLAVIRATAGARRTPDDDRDGEPWVDGLRSGRRLVS